MSRINEKKLREIFNKAVKKAGGRAEWCAATGVSPQQVCNWLSGLSGPGKKIPEALGYEPVVLYEEV